MRAFLLAFGMVALSGFTPAEPLPLTTDPHLQERRLNTPTLPVANPLLDATPTLVELPDAPVEETLRVSFDIGIPTGVRVQARLFHSPFWAEVGAGVYLIVPFVSTALRCDLRLYEDRRNSFAVRPSLSATFVPFDDIYYGFGGDVEFIWQHRFPNRMITDLGFRLGATAIQERHESRWFAAPVATVVFAIQF